MQRTSSGVCLLLILSACPSEPGPLDIASRSTVASFELPAEGCPMAHCDPAMSDRNPIPAPDGAPCIIERDDDVHGAGFGLGCSSNGSTAVCSFGSPSSRGLTPPFVVAYDARGRERWNAGDRLGPSAYASAPIVDVHGGAIAADEQTIIRFDENGAVMWENRVAGLPISPVPVGGDVVLVATRAITGTNVAPVLAYDVDDGELLGCLRLGRRGDIAGVGEECFRRSSIAGGAFATVNTPGARGARVYVSTQLVRARGGSGGDPLGRLYAIDVDRTRGPGDRLSTAWWFDFTGPSGASPLVLGDVVYFDGGGAASGELGPFIFAVRDLGDHPELLWQYRLARAAQASAAQDPRGGLWVFGAGDSNLIRLAEQPDDRGAPIELQRIDVDALLPGARPSSVMSIAGPASDPVMLVSSRTPQHPDLLAIDLVASALRWRMDTGASAFGQYPVMRDADGDSVIAVSTSSDGVLFAKTPQDPAACEQPRYRP